MKPTPFFSKKAAFILTTVCLVVSSASLPVAGKEKLTPQADTQKTSEPAAVITRYQVKKAYQDEFIKALSKYADYTIASEQNIMTEAFTEQENPSVLWLIERWNTKSELNNSHSHPLFKAIKTLSQKALEQPVKTIQIRDLEPVSKSAWRKEAAAEDTPIIIMLFVDSKAGTEENFKSVYHTAMPQFRSEPGVINYQLSQLEGDKTQFVTYEKFRNEDAFQYHLKFPPIKPVIDYLNTSIKQQPFQTGLHRLILIPGTKQ